MKEKTKEFLKKYLIGFILGVGSVCTVSVIAATYFPSNQTTYDNTNTELKSENVQDAIDELYGVCFPKSAGDQIIEDAGLEKDPYECRYFFTGANPNNYITFNGEEAGWRIISVECDGTIKIMKNESIGRSSWDSLDSNNWSRPVTLNTYLNEDYYNDEINVTAQSQIVAKDWSIGAVTGYNNDLANQVNDENNTKWNGKVALATVSEYIRSNSNKSSCGTLSLNNSNYNSCASTGWMDGNINWWTLSPYASISYLSFYISSDSGIYDEHVSNYDNPDLMVLPALYLSSEVTLTGSGTQSDPYVVNS